MALIPSPNLLQFFLQSPSTSVRFHYLFFGSPRPCSQQLSPKIRNVHVPLVPIAEMVSTKVRCLTKSTEENWWTKLETVAADDVDGVRKDTEIPQSPRKIVASAGDSLSLGIQEPVYEVVEVKVNGMVSTKKINRRQLLKSVGLRPRDIQSVDPSLFLTNSMPSLLVLEHAILLNLGSLRAIAMQEHVLIFDYNREGGKAYIDTLLPQLNPKNMNGGPSMPFMIEAIEAALLSCIQS